MFCAFIQIGPSVVFSKGSCLLLQRGYQGLQKLRVFGHFGIADEAAVISWARRPSA